MAVFDPRDEAALASFERYPGELGAGHLAAGGSWGAGLRMLVGVSREPV